MATSKFSERSINRERRFSDPLLTSVAKDAGQILCPCCADRPIDDAAFIHGKIDERWPTKLRAELLREQMFIRGAVANRLVALYNALHGGFSKFTLNSRSKHDRILQRLTLARAISPLLFFRLADDYLNNGKILKLWREIGNIRRAFVDNYSALQPLLQMPYWKESRRNPAAFILSDKRFDSLRQLYINCFETLCRLMVLALGIEAIIHHRSFDLRTKGRTLTLEEFERVPNANKPDFIGRYPIEDPFLPVIDAKLRNGIGHNAAHYDAERDYIVLYDTKKSGTVSRTMSYTEFSDRVLKLFAALELAGMYHHTIHIFLGGRLKAGIP